MSKYSRRELELITEKIDSLKRDRSLITPESLEAEGIILSIEGECILPRLKDPAISKIPKKAKKIKPVDKLESVYLLDKADESFQKIQEGKKPIPLKKFSSDSVESL